MNLQKQSLLLGLVTIFFWASLATLAKRLVHLPPFFILAVCFFMGSLPGFFKPKQMFPNVKTTLLGISGYFFYHFFLFYSFRFAPAIEVNLINYLWPILLVLFTPLFFKQSKLKRHHFVGGVLAIIGCFFLVMGEGIEFKTQHLKGYMLAFAAALTWPIYSLGKKKLPEVSVWAISGFCFGASLLAFMTHLLLEPHVVILSEYFFPLLLLGLGPFGLAFYTWDLALKKGDARLIGALSYLTPVLSTLGLVIFSQEELQGPTLMAMIFIVGGASTGLLDFLPQKVLLK